MSINQSIDSIIESFLYDYNKINIPNIEKIANDVKIAIAKSELKEENETKVEEISEDVLSEVNDDKVEEIVRGFSRFIQRDR